MAQLYNVIVYPEAEEELQEIVNYLEENVGYQLAINIQDSFFKTLEDLETKPTSFSLYRPDQYPDRKLRKAVIKKSWNLVFQVDQKGKTVYVLTIIHVKRGTSYIIETLK